MAINHECEQKGHSSNDWSIKNLRAIAASIPSVSTNEARIECECGIFPICHAAPFLVMSCPATWWLLAHSSARRATFRLSRSQLEHMRSPMRLPANWPTCQPSVRPVFTLSKPTVPPITPRRKGGILTLSAASWGGPLYCHGRTRKLRISRNPTPPKNTKLSITNSKQSREEHQSYSASNSCVYK